MTTITATLLPNGEQQFFSASGVPLAGGSVGMYVPGTLTFKNTWIDPLQATLNSNPIILDSGGRAVIYGSGQYRQRVFDVNNNLIWDQLTQDFLSLAQTGQYWGGTSGGTANAQTITTVPTFSSYIQPLTITFVAGFTNTGALTINANSIGALNVYKQTASGPVALTGGEVVNGNIYQISYDGTEWQLIAGAGSAIYWGSTSGGSGNAQTITTAPSFTAYVAGQVLYFIAGFSNTGATTINANGIGTKNIYRQTPSGPVALIGGEIVTNNVYQIVFDGTEFQLISNASQISNGGTTGGSANAQTATASGFSLTTGAILTAIAGFTNTGAATLAVNGGSAKNVYKTTGSGPVALVGGEITTNNALLLFYDGTEFQLLNPANQVFTKTPFTSTGQTISAAGALTLAHGLGVVPKLLNYYLTCTTNNLGYTAGQTVSVSPNTSEGSTNRGFTAYWDATNVYITFGSDASGNNIMYILSTTGNATGITTADWQFYVQAYA